MAGEGRTVGVGGVVRLQAHSDVQVRHFAQSVDEVELHALRCAVACAR